LDKPKSFSQALASGTTFTTGKSTNLTEENAFEGNNALEDVSLLIVPTSHGGKGALHELQRANVNLENFHVNKTVPLSSGGAIVRCETKEDKEKLQKVIDQLERVFVRKRNQTYPYSVRIWHIPVYVGETEISEAVREKFEEPVVRVEFMPYRDERKDRVQGAILIVSKTLFRKMENSPHIVIGGRHYHIDPSTYVNRCSNCQLLGHRAKFCDRPARSPPAPTEKCLDCTFYNESIRKPSAKKRELRDVNHPTDDDDCPLKKYVTAKWKSQREKSN
jgi:hypothetical protein